MRKLTAWEGPVAVVPPEFDGYVASPEFPTFTVDTARLDLSFASILCRQPAFWAALADRATGSVQRRKRVSPQRLLDVPIVLPPLTEQHRLADLLKACDEATAKASALAGRAEAARAALRDELIARADLPAVPLGDIVTIPSKLVDPLIEPYASMPHVGVDRIESKTGRLLELVTAREDGVTSGKHVFEPGDIVYAKIRTALAKVVLMTTQGLCSADAYPLRAVPGVQASYLPEALLTRAFVNKAVARSGRTKMPKINRAELFRLPVPLPETDEQTRIASLLTGLRHQSKSAAAYAEAASITYRALGEELLGTTATGMAS